MPRISPPLRQSVLGQELRELRIGRGMRLEDAAQKLRCSKSQVSLVEHGSRLVTPGYVRDALALYDADQKTAARCLQLVVDARRPPWWKEEYGKVLDRGGYVAYETEARSMCYWQAQVVPGLLQTFDYASEVIAADRPWETKDQIQLRARARLARQFVLSADDPLNLDVIIGEDALRRPVGGAHVMARQLGKILDFGPWPTISVRVLPRSVGAHAGMTCSFVLFSMHDLPMSLYREGGGNEIVEQGERVDEFAMRFEHLSATAMTTGQSADLIQSIHEEFVRADRGVA